MNLNENELEKLLRNPPRPKPPTRLKQRLIAGIELSASTGEMPVARVSGGFLSWLRRWWPALAPATVSLACAGVMVAQQLEARELRHGNAALAKQIAEEMARGATSPAGARRVDSRATDVLNGEQQEIAQLKERVAQLGSEVARLETTQKANEALRKQPTPGSGLSEEELAAVAKAREKALSIQCINNLKQIGLAVRIWANDSQDVNPPDFLSISNELNTPKILVCPADTNRVAVATFAKYSDANCSYEYLTPNATNADTEPQRVLTRCPIHGHIGLCDGSVQGEVGKKHPERLVMSNGKLYLDSAEPGK